MVMEFANEEEDALIRKVLFMPFVLRDIMDDRTILEKMGSQLRGNYVSFLEVVHDRAHGDVIDARKELQKRGISVYGISKQELGVYYTSKVRGWEHKGSYSWTMVERHVKELLQSYIEG